MYEALIVVALTITALVLCVAGFAANTRRYETRMKLPGFYWTWGTAIMVLVGVITGAPLWILAAGLVIFTFTAIFWVADSKAGASR